MPAVPIHQFVDRSPAVRIHWYGSAGLLAFDHPFRVEQIGHGLVVLVDITDA